MEAHTGINSELIRTRFLRSDGGLVASNSGEGLIIEQPTLSDVTSGLNRSENVSYVVAGAAKDQNSRSAVDELALANAILEATT